MKKLLLLLIIPFLSFGQENIIDFFSNIYSKYEIVVKQKYNDEYLDFCDKYQLDKEHKLNTTQFYKLLFLNKLFTTSGANKCDTGEILKIPYFKNWDGSRSEIKGHEKDEDRLPERYLKDLFTESPKYYHDSCKSFYTYGWCSEREMSFMAILHGMNFTTRIVVKGIHSNTEVYLELIDQNGVPQCYVITIDNTFDLFDNTDINACEENINDWLKEVRSHSTSKISRKNCVNSGGICSEDAINSNCPEFLMWFYNKPRHKDIKDILVPNYAQERIEAEINKYFDL